MELSREKFGFMSLFVTTALTACTNSQPPHPIQTPENRVYTIRGVKADAGSDASSSATNVYQVTGAEAERLTPAMRARPADAFTRDPKLEYRGEEIDQLEAQAAPIMPSGQGARGEAFNQAVIAAYKVGTVFKDGLGRTAKDPSNAERYLRAAADANLDAAQYDLAMLLLTRDGGSEVDGREALRYLNAASQQEYPPAMHQLALAYFIDPNAKGSTQIAGDGEIDYSGLVRRDPRRAAILFEKAAAHGVSESTFYIGQMYLTGVGIQQNPTKAIRFTREAAERGNVHAQRTLGLLYLEGYGTIGKDYNEAQRRLSDAASRGDEEAEALLEEIEAGRSLLVAPAFMATGANCMISASRANTDMMGRMDTAMRSGGNPMAVGPINYGCGSVAPTPSISGAPGSFSGGVQQPSGGFGVLHSVQMPGGERKVTVPFTGTLED